MNEISDLERQARAERELKIRRRARDTFEFFAPKCLRIAVKDAAGSDVGVRPFELNDPQEYVHSKLEAQLRDTGSVRAIILKGRQQGVSTYTEGRFYWKVIHRRGVRAYILTHKSEATDTLFDMVDRYHQNCPPMFRPHVGKSNAKELEFDRLDSRYAVATAGAKGAGRGGTVHFFHGSEVAFWENASDHMAGALQAVPDMPGTEVILESTANGVGNEFHRLAMEALAGRGRFILIFVPWFWSKEYRADPGEDFELSDSSEDVDDGELTEAEYARLYRLSNAQMAWRRQKIVELGYWKFKQEYPATVAEAFQASGQHSLIPVRALVRARKFTAPALGPLVIGVDPSHYGDDAFAIIRRRGRKIFSPQQFHKLSIQMAVGLLLRILKNERPKHMFVDASEPGASILDLLYASELVQSMPGVVVGVNFGGETFEPDRFKNKRAEMYWHAKEWFDDPAGVDVPDEDQFQAEAVASRFFYDTANRLQIESKEQMRKRGIASPNLFDAAVLTFAHPVAADEKMPGVHVDQMAGWPDPFSGSGDDWGGWNEL